MLRTLRSRLILSHILPMVVIVPLMYVALSYLLETRFLIPKLAQDLLNDARLLSEISRAAYQATGDLGDSRIAFQQLDLNPQVRLVLLDPNGSVAYSNDPDYQFTDERIQVPGWDKVQEGEETILTNYSFLPIGDDGEVVRSKPPPSFWDSPKEQLPEIFRLVETSPKTFSGVVDSHFQRVRVTARTAVAGSSATKELVREIETYAATFFPRGIQTQVTGNLVLISNVSDVVLSGQIESIGLAYAVILMVLILLFLSVRVGLAAMVPNVLPNLVFFGVMGWGGIQLNLATSIIGAVALGIGVDDTIHYMARLNQVVKATHSHRDALLSVMRTVGRPVVATSLPDGGLSGDDPLEVRLDLELRLARGHEHRRVHVHEHHLAACGARDRADRERLGPGGVPARPESPQDDSQCP